MVLVENYAVQTRNWLHCFDNAEMSDVVVEAMDGRTFHCHKLVLAIASPHFKNLFFSGKETCSREFVTEKDLHPVALKWILRACYTGDGDVDDENVVSVMVAAKKYEMTWVENACMKYLKEDEGRPLVAFEYSSENEKWQEWKAPKSGWYHIVAFGAKAADSLRADAQSYLSIGGMGAIVGATFEFKADDVVQILTGGMSRMFVHEKRPNSFSGGGGGTFVAIKKKDLSLLIAAGGGGSINGNYYGTNANLGEDGTGATAKYPGGKNGGNGAGFNFLGDNTGGLGWKAGPDALAKRKTSAIGDNGGFGGGGNICGGGGGYSGGSAGYGQGGGGGGSYVISKAVNSWKKVGNSGHGKVLIWSGKDVPTNKNFFLKEVGPIGEDSLINLESIHEWELLQ